MPHHDNFAPDALVALGSNQFFAGNSPLRLINQCIDFIRNDAASQLKNSRCFGTLAYPEGSGPDFVNAVVGIKTALSPQELMRWLHQTEQKFDRARPYRWAPRTLDLDLIAYGGQVLPDARTYAAWRDLPPARQGAEAPSELILPHPRMHERAFVLVPLCDVAPGWRHPVLGQTAQQLRDALPPAALAGVWPLEG